MFKGDSFAQVGKQNPFGGPNSDIDARSDFADSFTGSNLGQMKRFGDKKGFRDTISEIYDPDEKDAVFRSSMKKGGALNQFNELRYKNQPPGQNIDAFGQTQSPQSKKYQEKSPQKQFAFNEPAKENVAPSQKRVYPQPELGQAFRRQIPNDFDNDPYQQQQKPMTKFPDFQPSKFDQLSDTFSEINNQFGLKPKGSQTCKKHRQTEIEYYDSIQNEFICKMCAKNVQFKETLISVYEAQHEIQEQLNQLKHIYLMKKTYVIDRLTKHQNTIEQHLKIYYDILDKYRQDVLSSEYTLRRDMDEVENELKRLLSSTQKFTTTQFFHEQDEIKRKVQYVQKKLTGLSSYLPNVQLKMEPDVNIFEFTKALEIQIKQIINKNIQPTDQRFAISNYKYITEELGNPQLAKIYQLMGPFNFFEYEEPRNDDEDDSRGGKSRNEDQESQNQSSALSSEDERRMPTEGYEKRKSGALYKGDLNTTNKRPDGRGIKIHNKSSLYEGYFIDGQCQGLGRGITSKGDVYQGMFVADQMEGKGMFYFSDGRIYEGDFLQGKKHGKGRYFWPNGQVYEGEFKNDQCVGIGIIFYPDGKRFEGNWKDGQKSGKGTYIFPNLSTYTVIYQGGKKTGEAKMEKGFENAQELKEKYQSLAKKAVAGKEFLQNALKNFQVGQSLNQKQNNHYKKDSNQISTDLRNRESGHNSKKPSNVGSGIY